MEKKKAPAATAPVKDASAAKQRVISFVTFVGFLVASIIFTCIVMKVDVRPVGPQDTYVGLSHINAFIHGMIGEHLFWYAITTWLGVFAMFIAAGFAVLGCLQLAQRKSLFRVDREIVLMGAVYVIMLFLYIFFEFKIVNYRPMIMPGMTSPEASFPSSHTMLVCVIGGCAIAYWSKRKEMSRIMKSLLIFFAYVLMAVTVVGRLLCGVHWFSDIIAGVLYSGTLVFAYNTLIIRGKEKEKEKPLAPPKPEKHLTPYGTKTIK
ncbi:MAG: phosphatase PAP2 family protein [Dorea sp.]|nr:phosphatase PAP2 family protein [Dorea sp.]